MGKGGRMETEQATEKGGSRGDEWNLLSAALKLPRMLFFPLFFLFLLRCNSHIVKFTFFTLLKCAVVQMVFFSSQVFSLPVSLPMLLNLLFFEVCIFLKFNCMGLLGIA